MNSEQVSEAKTMDKVDRNEWDSVVTSLLNTIDDLVGYDVLIHHAVEHELGKAYKLGLAAAEARSARLTEAQQWVSVQDRMPEMRETYAGGPKRWRGIIYNGHYVEQGRLEETYERRKLTWKDSGDRCCKPTHWMELPVPPEALAVEQPAQPREEKS